SLNQAQRKSWQEGQVLTHVRFENDGEAVLAKRISAAANIAKALLERMTEAWGPLDQIKARHIELIANLRNFDKNDLENRRPIIAELEALPAKIEAMAWANELAEMTPETTTPLRFSRMSDQLTSLGRLLGEPAADALSELAWTLRING